MCHDSFKTEACTRRHHYSSTRRSWNISWNLLCHWSIENKRKSFLLCSDICPTHGRPLTIQLLMRAYMIRIIRQYFYSSKRTKEAYSEGFIRNSLSLSLCSLAIVIQLNSGRLTWPGRAQQPQEQRYPFLSWCAVFSCVRTVAATARGF